MVLQKQHNLVYMPLIRVRLELQFQFQSEVTQFSQIITNTYSPTHALLTGLAKNLSC